MPFDPARVRALLFDVDGTLSDSDGLWTERMERFLRPIRFCFPRRELQPAARRIVMGLESPGNAFYHLLDRFGLDAPALRLLQWNRPIQPGTPPVYRIQNGVAALLADCAARLPMAVVSARDQASTLGFLEHFDLTRYFQCVVTAQTCRYTKPFPDPLLWAARQLGVAPEACLMVGDTTVDIRAGQAARAQTAGVLCGFGSEAELRQARADVILPATEMLQSILTQ